MPARPRAASLLALVAFAGGAQSTRADEGGVSFWVPGQYGSFAAVAPSPGWSLPLVYNNYGGSLDRDQQLTRGHLLSAGLKGSADGLFIVPTYTLGTIIFGAIPSFSMAFIPAYSAASANVGAEPFSLSRSDSVWGGSDLYPTAQLFWNKGGVNNFMAYLAGDIPVGSYSPDRLANIGIGHAAIDGGGAYTYLNTKTGTDFSATLGLTGNFENPSTNYTNGLNSTSRARRCAILERAVFRGSGRLRLSAADARPWPVGHSWIQRVRARAELVPKSGTISVWPERRSTLTCALTGNSIPTAGFRVIPSTPP